MRRHFLRVYLVLASIGLVLVVAASAVLHRHIVQRMDDQLEAALEQPVERLRQRLDRAHVHHPDQRRAFERTVRTRLGMPARVVPLDDVRFPSDALRDRVLADEVVTVRERGRRATVARITDDLALVVGPVPEPANGRFVAVQALTFATLLLGLGVGVVLSLRPLERRLSGLATAADRLGDGDWDARADLRGDAFDNLADRFNTMATRVGAQVEEHRALLGAVSHELRTPLARLYLLLDDAAETDPATRARALERMDRSLGEMNELVDELLAWARLDAGSLTREPVRLDALVDEVVAAHAELAGDVTIDVAATDRVVDLDPRGTRRVLRNLIGNATRYARQRVEVRVHVHGRSVHIVVDDDGPGVPADARDRVFDPFVTLDPARSNARGAAGLGLAIVDRVSRAHGGTARCEASPLGGARFAVTLDGEGVPPT